MTLTSGTRLGSYEIVAAIGAGGMGEVFRARDTKLQRDVAIKVLPVAVAKDPEVLARFEREALAVAALSHPNILTIFDFGSHDGVTFAVTELLEGETLREKLNAGPILQKQAVDYVVQIARGLSAAHEKGVIHRDLKPENLIVTKDGHLKILDFGLAKRVEAVAPGELGSGPTVSRFTEPGTVMGTVGYMSPEQVRGLPVDHRSDIFSLGTVLYELLSGNKAFKRDTASDTMAAIMRDSPPELSQSSRNISPALDHIMLHCLEKDRENRFQTAKDVAFALSEASDPSVTPLKWLHRDTSPPQAGVPSQPGIDVDHTSASGRLFGADRRSASRLWVALAAVMVGVLAISLWLGRKTKAPAQREAQSIPMSSSGSPTSGGTSQAEASIAVLPFLNMSGDPSKDYFSDGMSEELMNRLANTPSLRVAARTSSFAFKGKNVDIKEIGRVLAVRAVLEGSVREEGNRLRITAQLINAADGYHLWSETYDRDLTGVLAVQDEIASAITTALTHTLLGPRSAASAPKPSMDPESYRMYLEGKHYFGPHTKEGVDKAVELFKQVTAREPGFADGFAALGSAYLNQAEDYPQRMDLMPAAEAALARALELDPNSLSALATHLDLALHKLDWEVAIDDAHRLQSVNPNSRVVLGEMFRYYQVFGFPEQALAATSSAAKLDPLSVVPQLNVAAALLHNGRFAEGAAAAKAALTLAPNQPFIQSLLCTAYAHSGRLEEARNIAKQFAQSNDKSDADGCLFDIAVGQGRLANAEKITDDLAARFPNSNMSAVDLADNYAVTGNNRRAVEWLARAYDAKKFTLFTIRFDKSISPAFFDDPGWKALWQRPLFKEWQAAHEKIAAELASGK